MILVTKGFFLTKPNEFLIHTHIYIHNKQRFTFISYIACEDLSFTLCLHGREGAKERYSRRLFFFWMGGWWWRCDPRLLRVARNPRAIESGSHACLHRRVRTHARTHVHSSYKHRGVVHELLRVPSSTDLFFFFLFFSLFFPRTLFLLSYTPTDRTVYGSHTAVDNVRARGNRFYWSCRELSDASSAWWHGFEQCYHIQRCILSFIYFSSFLPFAKLTLYTLTVYSFAVIQYNREK